MWNKDEVMPVHRNALGCMGSWVHLRTQLDSALTIHLIDLLLEFLLGLTIGDCM